LFKDAQALAAGEGLLSLRHRTIEKVGSDIEAFRFNTAISALDIYLNEISSQKPPARADAEAFLSLLNPFAPHLSEELWERLGKEPFLSLAPWPDYDPSRLKDEEVELVVQVNGKARDRISAPTDSSESEIQELSLVRPKVREALAGKKVVKVIVVPNRLVNIVVK
ncbi:MAG: class I tRNA ligase family protein, partial [Elusimicrobiota bacterium]